MDGGVYGGVWCWVVTLGEHVVAYGTQQQIQQTTYNVQHTTYNVQQQRTTYNKHYIYSNTVGWRRR